MAVFLIVLLTLAVVIYWFAGKGGIRRIRAKAARKKAESRRAAEQSAPLRAIDDPRDAATVLMLLICSGSEPTEAQTARIEDTLRTVFGLGAELDERMSHARFVARAAEGFDQAAQIFSGLFRQRLTGEERSELIGMLEHIAALDGPSQAQAEAIAVLAARIDLSAEWPTLMWP